MYKVCIYNNGIETVIQYPSADQDVPHLKKLPLNESLSSIDKFSFSIYTDNIGYNLICELTTKIKVIDIRDNTIRFTGRILNAPEKMDSGGQFYKDVLCESAESFLNDSKQRSNTFITSNVTDFLNQILSIHNSKVEDSKKIYVGNVDVTAPSGIAYTCNFKTTLETILDIKDKCSINGDIRVRESNGILYLDWLQSFSNNTVEVRLGQNMKDMVKGKDITSLGTHIIPLGANNLTIGTPDYIEDTNAKNIYGVIEKTVEYKDITNATELYNTCLADLSKYTQPVYLLECNALDLSYITGSTVEQFVLGTNLHIINPVMSVDDTYKIVALDLDLLQPYNPKLIIANAPVKLTSAINDLRKTSLQDGGVYNNVMISNSYGIRAVRSDSKVTTEINATEGISIKNETKKVFSVDTNGNIVCNDITSNDMTANEGTFNNILAQGGTFNGITANDITVEKGTITGATLQTSKAGSGRERITITGDIFSSYNASGQLSFTIDGSRIKIYDSGNYVGSIYGAGNYLQIDLPANRQFVLTENGVNQFVYYNNLFDFLCNVNVSSNLSVGGDEVATKSWVMDYLASQSSP